MLDQLIREFREACRALAKSKALALASVASLALGIGANLTALALLRAIEFPALPYPNAGALIRIDAANVLRNASGYPLSRPDYDDIRTQSRTLVDLGVSQDVTLTLREGTDPSRLGAKRVSPSFFSTLGVPAAAGRVFTTTDLASDLTRVVVLSHGVWAGRFGRDPRLVGRAVHIDGEPYTVLGIMPPRFDDDVDAWVPLGAPNEGSRDDRQYTVIARLREPGHLDATRAELRAIAERLATAYPATNRDWELEPIAMARIRSRESGGGYWQLQAAVAVLLLIACANVGNLLLARGIARRREIGIRLALGARRWQVFRMVLAEGLVLALIGGGLGVLLSQWGTAAAAAVGEFPDAIHIPADALSVLAALLLSLLTGFLIAILPAASAARLTLVRALRESAARGATTSGSHARSRALLVIAEISCALLLLTGATLLARSLWNRQQRDLGFDPAGAVQSSLAFEGAWYDNPDRIRATADQILRRVGGLSGVRAIGMTGYPFATRFGTPIPVIDVATHGDVLGADAPRALANVTPQYFAALGIPLRRGRVFGSADRLGSERVAIVNEELARLAWPGGRDAIGQRVAIGSSTAPVMGSAAPLVVTVVGVVGSIRRSAMHDRILPVLYVPFDQFPSRSVTLTVRGMPASVDLVSGVRAAIRESDPALIVEDTKTVAADLAAFLRPTRLYATLLATFASLALILATIGVYASMAYSVSQRTRELGIRLALGASTRALLRLILGEGMRLAVFGIVLGITGAIATTRLLASLLYGVGPIDPLTLASAGLVLLGAVLVACYAPARRSTRVDPAITLRVD